MDKLVIDENYDVNELQASTLKWKEIWIKREIKYGDDKLLSLIRLDGFDHSAGNISKVDWMKYVNWIKSKLVIDGTSSIFEIGCGGGAFIYPFYKMGHRVGGIDYSDSMIKNIQNAIPSMKFYCCEAAKLKVSKKFDVVISNSVFQYFPSYDYAEEVVNKMLNKAIKKIAVLDINDIDKKNSANKLRRGTLSEEEYKTKYSGLDHLFYDKTFFIDIAKEFNCNAQVFSQNIRGYGNNPLRFNVIISK